MKQPFRFGILGLLALASAPLFALSGTGDSAPGSLDTVGPTPGTAIIPSSGILTGETISYTGASDVSGIARVELWAREDSGAWADSGEFDTGLSGSFFFVPGGTGTYHFDLVAEDTLGNRSVAPSGTLGTGQGSTIFTSGISDWMIFE